ncbi:RT0821/Lpp0805 family surface protein [Falsiroseomonas sp. CW058]|uniref:RT0821/Lpp0805 family surface protein n=1 Tax=Falsiroseomonas sp. CW058 TaxID=3388664 RepID=UPI003D31B911
MRLAPIARRAWPLALAALLLLPGTAAAQWRNIFPGGASLTEEDLRAQQEAMLRLLRAEPPPVGQGEDWSNPRTGARGTVTLLGASEVRRMPCRRMRFQITPQRAGDASDLTFNLCRGSDGLWKIG